MTKASAIKMLNKYINENYKNYSDFANDIGVSSAYISQQLSGDGPLSNKLLSAVGLKRATEYSYQKIGKLA